MSKFKKKQGNVTPGISTASLPDIVFMLLFFFMVVTKMRDTELMVKVNTPQASELTKLEKKTLVNFIFVGRPTDKYKTKAGTKPVSYTHLQYLVLFQPLFFKYFIIISFLKLMVLPIKWKMHL